MNPKKKRPGRRRTTIKGELPQAESSSAAIDNAPAIHEYVTFTLELMQTGDMVSRARILHVKSKDECVVEGWDEQAVLAFVRKYAGIPAVQPEAQKEKTEPFDALNATIGTLVAEGKSVANAFAESVDADPDQARNFTLLQGEQHTVNTLLKAHQRWKMRLTLESPHLSESDTRKCLVVAQARQLGAGTYHVIANCVMPLAGTTNTLEVEMLGLAPGAYRIEAGVCVEGDPFEPPLQSWLEGPLVQVY